MSRAKITEFATALGETNPAYFGDDPVAPPTFAALIAAQSWGALFADDELGLRLERTIHADQNFSFTRPLRAGDEVVATLTITKVRQRGQSDMVSVAVDVATTAGEPICTASSQLIHTSSSTQSGQQA